MPVYASEDFNILKRFRISESRDVLLQASFINAFNRHVFNRPDLNPNDYNYANCCRRRVWPPKHRQHAFGTKKDSVDVEI